MVARPASRAGAGRSCGRAGALLARPDPVLARRGGWRQFQWARPRAGCRRTPGGRHVAGSMLDPSGNPLVNFTVSKAAQVIDDISNQKKQKRLRQQYNGTFSLVLINLLLFVLPVMARAGLSFLSPLDVSSLMLHHNRPHWYQFVTCTFVHVDWHHLSSNLFLLLIFGKLVEEEEGAVGVWMTYLICGACASLASLLYSSKHAVSLGASGAVFGLFAVSVLVRLSFNFRKLVESAIVGQFVWEQLRNEMRTQAGKWGSRAAAGSVQVSHVAHIAGAFAGVALILLISRLPAAPTKKGRRS